MDFDKYLEGQREIEEAKEAKCAARREAVADAVAEVRQIVDERIKRSPIVTMDTVALNALAKAVEALSEEIFGR